MQALTIEALGLSQEEITNRVVERIVAQLLDSYEYDEDGNEVDAGPTRFMTALQKRVAAKVDEAVESIAAKNVLPNVETYVENLCLQETNRWGEPAGKKMTFVEYLVARAEAYLTEMVDFHGKAKIQGDSYSWRGTQTRVAYLVHEHLHYSIESAMKKALENANSAIVDGLRKTVLTKLAEVAAALKVEVKTGR